MNRCKKIFAVIVLTGNFVIHASDNVYYDDAARKLREQQYAAELQKAKNSTVVWAGVAGFVGAVAGAAIGTWIANSDADTQTSQTIIIVDDVQPYQQEQLSAKGRQIKAQLDKLAKYGQDFEFHNNDHAMILNLHKIGFTLDQIDDTFFDQLAQDYKTLYDAGYAIWWNAIKPLEYQKDLYLLHCKKLIDYFHKNKAFIQCCQIINYYDKLPTNARDLPAFIRCTYRGSQQYPLMAYKNKVENDLQTLVQFRRNSVMSQIALVQKIDMTKQVLNYVLEFLYACKEYQQEVDQKRHDELVVYQNRIEQEKLEIARQQARALEQANQLAAERNRIDRERNQQYRHDR